MTGNRGTLVALALVAAMNATACFKTKINTQLGGAPMGPEYERRQWFTIGGLVPLSSETGQECTQGVATATSREGGIDILIGIGLSVTGMLIGASACSLPENPTAEDVSSYSLCSSVVAAVPPLLLGSRTVTYRCRS